MLKKIRDFLKTGSIVWILEMVYIIGFMTVQEINCGVLTQIGILLHSRLEVRK